MIGAISAGILAPILVVLLVFLRRRNSRRRICSIIPRFLNHRSGNDFRITALPMPVSPHTRFSRFSGYDRQGESQLSSVQSRSNEIPQSRLSKLDLFAQDTQLEERSGDRISQHEVWIDEPPTAGRNTQDDEIQSPSLRAELELMARRVAQLEAMLSDEAPP
ncbi:hypothetical protein V5O48_015477, partial [Marasmius crinis-equi]